MGTRIPQGYQGFLKDSSRIPQGFSRIPSLEVAVSPGAPILKGDGQTSE
jgi:hypothetical protein